MKIIQENQLKAAFLEAITRGKLDDDSLALITSMIRSGQLNKNGVLEAFDKASIGQQSVLRQKLKEEMEKAQSFQGPK